MTTQGPCGNQVIYFFAVEFTTQLEPPPEDRTPVATWKDGVPPVPRGAPVPLGLLHAPARPQAHEPLPDASAVTGGRERTGVPGGPTAAHTSTPTAGLHCAVDTNTSRHASARTPPVPLVQPKSENPGPERTGLWGGVKGSSSWCPGVAGVSRRQRDRGDATT